MVSHYIILAKKNLLITTKITLLKVYNKVKRNKALITVCLMGKIQEVYFKEINKKMSIKKKINKVIPF